MKVCIHNLFKAHHAHVAQSGDSCFDRPNMAGNNSREMYMHRENTKKIRGTEEKSLFAVHLHSGNIFHVLHSPWCIFGLQS